jgi:hypothetical protein
MLLAALLLAATPAVCPDGFQGFVTAVSQAARQVGVFPDLFVEIVPSYKAPAVPELQTKFGRYPAGKGVAWISNAQPFDWTIYVRYDMAHAMSCEAYRLVATHEVCHISLYHIFPSRSPQENLNRETEAGDCVKRFLSPLQWIEYNRLLTSADLLTQRERIEPQDPNYFAKPVRLVVPKR